MPIETNFAKYLIQTNEVAAALKNNLPVVALESTIITHGMPWPHNLNTAKAVESEIRNQGAIPATIAVIEGKIHVGLTSEELENLARMTDHEKTPVMKLSRADLAFAVSQKRTGSTTVAATMMLSQMAGIEVFATGGIGGVHKDGENSFDISADLTELAQTNVAVICAGAKAILDIERTLEVLETNGVPVITYGSDYLPAFWSAKSGILSPLRLDDAGQIANLINTRLELGHKGGLLIANPIPVENEIPTDKMKTIIDQAVNEGQKADIKAKAVTPWLLSRIYEITDGASLETNVALIKNNARLAGQIAGELVKLR